MMKNEMVPAAVLWKSTFAAIAAGLVALVTLILPAEYNIDPTGIGKKLGLTALSPEVLAEAKEASAKAAASEPATDSMGDMAELVVPPNSGLEYKMVMQAGDQVNFEWSSTVAVNVDMHGDPKGDMTGYFLSYVVANNVSDMKGSFITAFEGNHGWYFKNNSDQPAKVQLLFNGQYENPHLL